MVPIDHPFYWVGGSGFLNQPLDSKLTNNMIKINGDSQKPAYAHLLTKEIFARPKSRLLIGSAHGLHDRSTPL